MKQNDDFELFGDNDPWTMIMDMQELLVSLTHNHNALVNDYKNTVNRIHELEKQATRLKFMIEELEYKMETKV